MSKSPKDITTLIDDIYGLLDRGVSFTPDPSYLRDYSKAMEGHMSKALDARKGAREKGKMWFSDLGEKCARKTWYKWNGAPGVGEELRGNTLFKFLYGNSIEESVLYLAKEAGHKVEREQERIEYKHEPSGWTISGRIDAYIDGVLVDVKSCSSFAFKKYKQEGITASTDNWGYRYQLSGYDTLAGPVGKSEDLENKYEDELIIDRGIQRLPAFIFADKQNGSLLLSPIEPLTKEDILDEITNVAASASAPFESSISRGYSPVPEGKSGNLKLGVECSYCPYKFTCWPGLKGYAYSYGPVYLTKVVREPNVPRIKETNND